MQLTRENLVILVLATLVAGFVLGRASHRVGGAGAQAVAPPAAMPQPPTETSEPARASSAESAPARLAAPAESRPAALAESRPASRPAPPPVVEADDEPVWAVTLSPDDPTAGPEDAAVIAVVFSAFGCEPCLDFAPAVDRLLAEYGDRVQVRWKQKLISADHPDAPLAAEASLAAHAQGRFWEFRQAAFEAGFRIARPDLERIAAEIGLDVDRFRRDLDSGRFRAQALADSLLAHETGSHSFPNVLVNGVRMPKPKNWTSLQALVEQELARAEREIAAGTRPAELYTRRTVGGKTYPSLLDEPTWIDTAGRPRLGPEDADLQVVVFADFQCPFCAQAAPNLSLFQESFPESVSVVFKHFPLANDHPDAQLAAEAAEEAFRQGRFWEYHDLLFANQGRLGRADLEAHAERLGLDMEAFRRALDTRSRQGAVETDLLDGRRAGVSSTPVIYFNGRRYRGPKGFDVLGMEAVARTHSALGS